MEFEGLAFRALLNCAFCGLLVPIFTRLLGDYEGSEGFGESLNPFWVAEKVCIIGPYTEHQIVTNGWTFLTFVLLVWGPHLEVHRGYSWFCSTRITPGGPYGMLDHMGPCHSGLMNGPFGFRLLYWLSSSFHITQKI